MLGTRVPTRPHVGGRITSSGGDTAFRPQANCLSILPGKSGIAVDQQIRTEGHVAGFHLAACRFEFLLCIFRRILDFGPPPLRKIQVSAALTDVARDEPRDRGHVGVPRPSRQVRMAVVAGAHEDPLDGGRHLDRCFQRVSRHDWRIGSRGSEQLNHNDQGNESSHGAACEFLHGQSSTEQCREVDAGDSFPNSSCQRHCCGPTIGTSPSPAGGSP